MKLTYLQSASVVIEDKNVKILCDPWLVDGAYLGSWALYPPYDFNPDLFSDVDFIYISHVHPDHFNVPTLKQLKKTIPIIIHDFPVKYLKNNLEKLGFKVIEIPHNKRVHLKNDVYINILAADNCDPQLCSKFFGCSFLEDKPGTNWIDTMSVIDNGEEVIVNTNDCPFELSKIISKKIKDQYKKIDMLLVGYSGASGYPHCFEMTEIEREAAAKKKTDLNYWRGENYIKLFEPKYFMPFAGRYVLQGKLARFNSLKGEPELEEGFQYLVSKIDQNNHQGILLNPNEYFDLTMGTTSKPYEPINKNMKEEYITNSLSKILFPYELDPEPSLTEIKELIPKCYDRFERTRKRIGLKSNTNILLELSNDELLCISCNGNGYRFISTTQILDFQPYLKMSLDKKLLIRCLKEPKLAHWNNAEGGSHIFYERVPEIFDRGLYYCFSFFHS